MTANFSCIIARLFQRIKGFRLFFRQWRSLLLRAVAGKRGCQKTQTEFFNTPCYCRSIRVHRSRYCSHPQLPARSHPSTRRTTGRPNRREDPQNPFPPAHHARGHRPPGGTHSRTTHTHTRSLLSPPSHLRILSAPMRGNALYDITTIGACQVVSVSPAKFSYLPKPFRGTSGIFLQFHRRFPCPAPRAAGYPPDRSHPSADPARRATPCHPGEPSRQSFP